MTKNEQIEILKNALMEISDMADGSAGVCRDMIEAAGYQEIEHRAEKALAEFRGQKYLGKF